MSLTVIAASPLLREKIEKWPLSLEIMSVTPNNASDMTNGICQVHVLLTNSYPSSYGTLSLFHVRCFNHIINLTLQDGVKIIHPDTGKVKFMINAERASTVRNHDFEALGCESAASGAML